jgi:hypothetical protein
MHRLLVDEIEAKRREGGAMPNDLAIAELAVRKRLPVQAG